MSEKFNTEVPMSALFVTGDILDLIGSEGAIQMMVMDLVDERVDLIVGDEIVLKDVALATATGAAKRILDPSYSRHTNFHTPREWEFKGVRMIDLVPGQVSHDVRGPRGGGIDRKARKSEPVLKFCPTCFIAVDARGVCWTCDGE